MNSDRINIFINSKNRSENETASKFYVKIPDGLLRLYDPNEYFTLNVLNFYCINSWYNCIYDFNDTFIITIKNNLGVVINEAIGRIPEGNPNVLYIKDYLIESLGNICEITYNVLQNKWEFYKLETFTDDIFITIVNSEDFLGFRKQDRGIEMEITTQGLKSSVPINVLGDETINIKIDGNVHFYNNNIDNYSDNLFRPSSIIFTKPIDSPSNSIIKYSNEDGGDSFQYIITNRDVEGFYLTVVNQDNELIPNFSEYTLTLQFVRNKTDDETKGYLKEILDFIRQIYFIVGRNMITGLKSTNTKKKS